MILLQSTLISFVQVGTVFFRMEQSNVLNIIVECRHECSVILYSVTNAGMCSESVIVVHDVRTAFTIESRFSHQFEAV